MAASLAVLLAPLYAPRSVLAEGTPPASSTAAPTVATTPGTTQTELPVGGIVADSFFPWVSKDPKVPTRWTDGIVHFFLGLIGALVTVYLFLGESLPSMGGKAKYDLVEQELQDFKSRREKALKAREEYARGETEPPVERLEAELRLSNDYERTIRRLEAQLTQERWNLFLVGFPVYPPPRGLLRVGVRDEFPTGAADRVRLDGARRPHRSATRARFPQTDEG